MEYMCLTLRRKFTAIVPHSGSIYFSFSIRYSSLSRIKGCPDQVRHCSESLDPNPYSLFKRVRPCFCTTAKIWEYSIMCVQNFELGMTKILAASCIDKAFGLFNYDNRMPCKSKEIDVSCDVRDFTSKTVKVNHVDDNPSERCSTRCRFMILI